MGASPSAGRAVDGALSSLHVAEGVAKPAVSRRRALGSFVGAGLGAFGLLGAARAEMYGDGKAADKSQGAAARQLKFAKAGEETEAFKIAEAKRAEAAARYASGQKAKEETA